MDVDDLVPRNEIIDICFDLTKMIDANAKKYKLSFVGKDKLIVDFKSELVGKALKTAKIELKFALHAGVNKVAVVSSPRNKNTRLVAVY